MKIMFTVQGEGRGHMTQAIAVHEMLRRRGHQLSAAIVGGYRPLPHFFAEGLEAPIQRIASPSFSQKNNRGVSPLGSAAAVFRNLLKYRESLSIIDSAIRTHQPDLIINFLEPLMGVYNLLRKPTPPTLAIAHQFMMQHPSYLRVREFPLQRMGMVNYVRLTGARSAKLALSFYPAADLPNESLTVCPPILRRQLFEVTPRAGERLLVYLLFHAYSDDICQWHHAHPEIPIDCFYDKPEAPSVEQVTENLTFHQLDGEKFLRLMAECRGVVCTAGFESISEAAYLGKPLLMVPVENHLEQFINARDAQRNGLGIVDSKFALSRLLNQVVSAPAQPFQEWVNQAETILVAAVERAVFAKSSNRASGESRISQTAMAE